MLEKLTYKRNLKKHLRCIIHIGSKFGPWGFRILMYKIKRIECCIISHAVMFETYIMYSIEYFLGPESRMHLSLD